MNTENLKIIINAIQSMGEGTKEAFIIYVTYLILQPLVIGLAFSGVIFVAVRAISAAIARNRDAAVAGRDACRLLDYCDEDEVRDKLINLINQKEQALGAVARLERELREAKQKEPGKEKRNFF